MQRPKLRRLERVPLRREDDELVLVLRDPLELVEPFAIDAVYGPVLDALDGQRTVAQVRQSLLMRGVVDVDGDDLEAFVASLAELGLLDDERFRALWARAHDAFVERDVRGARRAGLLYPDDPGELREWLRPALPTSAAPGARERGPGWAAPIGLVTPHQRPPDVGAPLSRALAALPPPDAYARVVVLATDHSPGLLPYAACDKDWGTPLGPVPADLEGLAALHERAPWILREQVRLRTSDPAEWATLLMRALWGDRCPPVLVLACGQTRLTTADGRDRGDELLAALGVVLEYGPALLWSVAELSHAGPAFGGEPVEAAVIAERERDMLAPLLDGSPRGFTRHCMDRPPGERPSGVASLSTLAELLPVGYTARLLDHPILPAPGDAVGWIGCPLLRFDAPA